MPGVANVAIWGQRLRQMHVHFDPDRLRDARLMQDDIIAAAGDALWVSPLTFLKGSAPGTGGWIDNRNQRLGVAARDADRSARRHGQGAIGAATSPHDRQIMALGDVAEVTFSHPPLIGDAVVNGGNGLLLVIEKFPVGQHARSHARRRTGARRVGRGPPGRRHRPDRFRLASYIEDSHLQSVLALIVGALLLVLVAGGFLSNWRSALVSVVSIPCRCVAALLVLKLTGASSTP